MFSLISFMRSFSGDVSTEFGAGGADTQVGMPAIMSYSLKRFRVLWSLELQTFTFQRVIFEISCSSND